MNLTELKVAVSNASGLTQADSEKAIRAVFSSVTEALKGGETVSVVGFGAFSVGDRPARTGRNPRTGEEIKIPASKVVKFKAGKGLKDAVNAGQSKKKRKSKK